MNVLDIMQVKSSTAIFSFEPEEIILSRQEEEILPALLAELIDYSVVSVSPKHKVGRIMVFDVVPYKSIDPPLIYCKCLDLSEYYFIWKIIIIDKGSTWNRNVAIREFDEMIKGLDISSLTPSEGSFLMANFLTFKNEHIRRM